MNKKLVIIGAGGHGKVCADIAVKMKAYSEILFLDDGDAKSCLDFPVVGKVCEMDRYVKDCDFFVAVGNGAVRERITKDVVKFGGRISTLIHPSAVVGIGVKIGKGSVVMAGAVINPEVKIGEGVIVNTCASIDHDSVVGDYCHVSVGTRVAGTVKIGDNCFLGAGTVVINNVNIVADCVFGAGAVIVNDITDKGKYIGVPARLIKKG